MTTTLQIGWIFYCPFCGTKFDVNQGDGIKYCKHVQFGYVWGGDPDFFTYVSKGFGQAYIEKIRESPNYKEYLDENEISISQEEEEKFARAEFKAGDEISQIIPFLEDIALSVCSENTVLFKAETTYSGFIFAVDNEEGLRYRYA